MNFEMIIIDFFHVYRDIRIYNNIRKTEKGCVYYIYKYIN